jgi:hypothetical protein
MRAFVSPAYLFRLFAHWGEGKPGHEGMLWAVTLEPLEGVLGEMPMVNHSPLLVIYRLQPVTEHPDLAYYREWDILTTKMGVKRGGMRRNKGTRWTKKRN